MDARSRAGDGTARARSAVACSILFAVVAGALAGCISESARSFGDTPAEPADVSDASEDSSAPEVLFPVECVRNNDCAARDTVCKTSQCLDGRCVSEDVSCDDAEPCTDDRCDTERGCVHSQREVGSACVVGASETCDGERFNRRDACDADGKCVDGGVDDCSTHALGTQCQRVACEAPAGCVARAENDGAPCVSGRSDVCVDLVRHEPDACEEGVCADGGSVPCPTATCMRATCDGRDCGLAPVGLDVDITGTWNLFELSVRDGALGARTAKVVLDADGGATLSDGIGPSGGEPSATGSYCVSSDWKVDMLLGGGDTGRAFSGRLGRGRDMAMLTPIGREGVALLVKSRPLAEAQTIAGTYRLVGLETLQLPSGPTSLDALLGELVVVQACVTGGHYMRSNQSSDVKLEIDAPACLEFPGDNALRFTARTSGDARTWTGVVGENADYAVLQRAKDGGLAPSLLVLVRTGLALPGALEGQYAIAQLAADGADTSVRSGRIGFDGAGGVTGFALGDATLASGDEATAFVSTSPPEAGLLVTMLLGGEKVRRVGQLGPASSTRVDWFVDIGTTPIGSLGGPVNGRTLGFGVREP